MVKFLGQIISFWKVLRANRNVSVKLSLKLAMEKKCVIIFSANFTWFQSNMFLKGYPLEAKTASKNWN